MITIVGGVYNEHCMSPNWYEVYGSAGRAATAIARAGGKVELHSYLDEATKTAIEMRAVHEGFQVHATPVQQSAGFSYVHGLATPKIHNPHLDNPSISVKAERVVRFGMLEGDAIVDAEFAVYDPQDSHEPKSFRANGSQAKHLALILNRQEAFALHGKDDLPEGELAQALAVSEAAEVVIIKMGPLGALIYDNGNISQVPAYSTETVWKIGSGDHFVAHFALAWLEKKLLPHDAADFASRATAYYCAWHDFPSQNRMSSFTPRALTVSDRYKNGFRPNIYLAGPFFTLAQLWLVEEALSIFRSMGMNVFSPYHDVGPGAAEDVVQKDLNAIHECDLMFAIGDSLDAGTLYEIGYARALKKPVIMYTENESEEDKKMMEGSHCTLCSDFVTAIYKTVWEAAAL